VAGALANLRSLNMEGRELRGFSALSSRSSPTPRRCLTLVLISGFLLRFAVPQSRHDCYRLFRKAIKSVRSCEVKPMLNRLS